MTPKKAKSKKEPADDGSMARYEAVWNNNTYNIYIFVRHTHPPLRFGALCLVE